MDWKKHLIIGVILQILFLFISLIIYKQYSTLTLISIIAIIIILFSSPLMPDLDIKQGKLREWLTLLGFFVGLIGLVSYYMMITSADLIIFGFLFAFVSFSLCYITKHRGITHSFLFIVLFLFIVYITTKNVSVVIQALIGIYSHLLLDGLYIKIL